MPENHVQHNESPSLSPDGKARDACPKNKGWGLAVRIPAVYFLAFLLLLLLDAGRAAPMLEREGAERDLPFLRSAGQALHTASEATGLAALTRFEGRVLVSLSPELTLGALRAEASPPYGEQGSAGEKAAARGNGDASSALAAQGREASAVDAALNDLRRSLGTGPENGGPASAGEASLATPSPSSEQAFVQTGGQTVKSPGAKPRVLLIGDSMMMEGFGPILQRMLRARPDLDVIREGKYSTGLSRVDYFDWGSYLAQLIQRDDPDLVLICLGANDPQDIIDENGKRHIADSSSWKELYLARAKALLRVATQGGARVIWAGLPIMSKEPYSTRIRHLSDLHRAACTSYMAPEEAGRARFVDTVSALADAKGEYTSFAPDATGQAVRLRYKDKVHVTEEGGRRLAERVIPFILGDLGLPEKAPLSSAISPLPPAKAAGAAQKTASDR